MTEPFIIEELTGSRRSVELSDRALPYRPMALPGEQRTERTHYPGNPVATIQVLGPDETTAEIRGRLKDRFFIGARAMVALSGFDSIVPPGTTPTVQDLVNIFHTLRRSGNYVEVRWGPEVRRGVMKRFEPSWHRLDVVEWVISFEWSQIGSFVPSPFATASSDSTTDTTDLSTALSDFNAGLSDMPGGLFPNIVAQSIALGVSIASVTLDLITSVAAIGGVPFVPMSQFQGVSSYASVVVSETSLMRQFLGDPPPLGLVPTDDVVSLLAGGTWGRDMSYLLVALAVAAVEAREAVRDRAVSDYLADEKLREGQTLRDLALEYYGSADDWTILADANGLIGSVHPAGTRVLVPRREGQVA